MLRIPREEWCQILGRVFCVCFFNRTEELIGGMGNHTRNFPHLSGKEQVADHA